VELVVLRGREEGIKEESQGLNGFWEGRGAVSQSVKKDNGTWVLEMGRAKEKKKKKKEKRTIISWKKPKGLVPGGKKKRKGKRKKGKTARDK